ncbi:MAG: hypothetical protein MZU97_17675 [Bacillus subtilis]|nr:hypothetical protein [Bacillus subtilis]
MAKCLKSAALFCKVGKILFPCALLPAYLLVLIPMSPFILLLIYSIEIIWTVIVYQFFAKSRSHKEVLIFIVVMLISSFLFGYALSKIQSQWTIVESILLGLGLASAFVPNVLVAGKYWKKPIPEIQASHNDIDEHSKIRCSGSGKWLRKFICRGYFVLDDDGHFIVTLPSDSSVMYQMK